MKNVMIDVSKVDWKLLREQKLWLAAHDASYAEGLLSLLDHIMDQAAEILGEKKVFGFKLS